MSTDTPAGDAEARAREVLAIECEKHGFAGQATNVRRNDISYEDGGLVCVDAMHQFAAEAVAAERERCAKVAKATRPEPETCSHDMLYGYERARFDIADAILAKLQPSDRADQPSKPCSCEVAFGQNPECPAHGVGTAWRQDNPEADWRDAPAGDRADQKTEARATSEEVDLKDGEWFYPEGDHSSDECRFSPDEVIDYALEDEAASRVVCIERAVSLSSVYAAVRVWSDAEKDERQSDDDYGYTLHATAEEARSALRSAEA